MRVMVLVKATEDSENGVGPSLELMTAMGAFNEELVRAGVMLVGDGLTTSGQGKRVRFEGSARTVLDGPFAETKELVSGFWIWEVGSVDEAVEWLKKAPFDGGAEIEIRKIAGPEDFENMTDELRDNEARLRAYADSEARGVRAGCGPDRERGRS